MRGWQAAGSVLLTLLVLAVAGQWFYRLEVVDSLMFFGAVALAFQVPGSLIVAVADRGTLPAIERAALATAVGLAVFPLWYRVMRRFEVADVALIPTLGLLLLGWAALRYRAWRGGSEVGRVPRASELVWLGLTLVGILGLLHFSHFSDLVIVGDGLNIRNTLLTESVFHLGLVNALADTIPPPALYAAGAQDYAYYHFGMHLQIEGLQRLTGIDSVRLVSYYFPLLYFASLAALAYAWVRARGGVAWVAALAGVLVFGSDFSFLPGLLRANDVPWTQYFPSTIWSLFTLNGYLPATSALFAGIIALDRHFRDGGAGWVGVFVLCTLGAWTMKASMGVQMASAGVFTAAAWLWVRRPAEVGRLLLSACAAALVVLLVASLLLGGESERTVVLLEPFGKLRATLAVLGLGDTDIVWYPVWLVLALMAALGVRALGAPAVWEALRMHRPSDGSLLFIGVFFVIGYAVSELFFIGPEGGQNNASWFYVQSLMGAWFALFAVLARWDVFPVRRLSALALIVVLATPTTAQFLRLRSMNQYAHYGPDQLAVVEALKATDPGTVVLHPLNLDRPSLASNLAGRKSVLSPFLSFVIRREGLGRRGTDALTFFHPDVTRSQQVEILRRYGVTHVYCPRKMAGRVGSIEGMDPVVVNDQMALYAYRPD